MEHRNASQQYECSLAFLDVEVVDCWLEIRLIQEEHFALRNTAQLDLRLRSWLINPVAAEHRRRIGEVLLAAGRDHIHLPLNNYRRNPLLLLPGRHDHLARQKQLRDQLLVDVEQLMHVECREFIVIWTQVKRDTLLLDMRPVFDGLFDDVKRIFNRTLPICVGQFVHLFDGFIEVFRETALLDFLGDSFGYTVFKRALDFVP